MATKKGNWSVPPYVSAGEFQHFLDALSGIPQDSMPTHIDEDWLDKIGTSSGNRRPLLSALRWLRIIEYHTSAVKDTDQLAHLGDPNKRTRALKEIVQVIYAELLEKRPNLTKETIDSLQRYFENEEDVNEAMSRKVARFFVWIAQEAGYTLNERKLSPPPDRRPSPPRPSVRELPAQEEDTQPDIDQAKLKKWIWQLLSMAGNSEPVDRMELIEEAQNASALMEPVDIQIVKEINRLLIKSLQK